MTDSPSSPNAKRWIRWIALLLVAATAITLLVRFDLGELLEQALAWIDGLGIWGPILFVLIYVVAAALLIPGSALTLGAGALFGVVRGSLIVSLASTLAAMVAFLIGRYLARDAISRKLEGNHRFAAVDQAVARQGWKIVLLTRLSPVFPYTLLNYAFGLTRVRLSHYVLASWIGMMPGTVMYVYIGSIANAASEGKSIGQWILYGVGLLATVAVTVYVTRIAKQALARQIDAQPGQASD
jgi:uncharacterized membrane protein YdjX (TVP38/TMEM64 family)